MKVQFLGAAKTVTGSCYMIEACGKRFCVDCGMHQGNKAIEQRNRDIKPYLPGNIDFILITHAHIDHSGLLPLLVRDGFDKPVYCTKATSDLLEIMLQDSAHIQEMEAQWEAKKYDRRGLKNPPAALYTVEDAQKAATLFQPVDYHKSFEPAPGIRVTYYDAGHILGSGSLRLEAEENGKTTSMIFSGDIGRPQSLIVRDPESPPRADYVFMESTYGDRNHKNESTSAEELADAVAYSYAKGEKVIIPAFAVERTQEVLYCLHMLNSQGKLPENMPVFVDSPLAIRATEIFERNRELFDEDAKALLGNGDDPFSLPNLHYTLSTAESQAINAFSGPAIVISASGMCNAGRIKHHLKHNIWKPGASVVFVGYQAVGTPGRKLVEHAKKITLFGEDIEVAARIFTINGFSGPRGPEPAAGLAGPARRRRHAGGAGARRKFRPDHAGRIDPGALQGHAADPRLPGRTGPGRRARGPDRAARARGPSQGGLGFPHRRSGAQVGHVQGQAGRCGTPPLGGTDRIAGGLGQDGLRHDPPAFAHVGAVCGSLPAAWAAAF